MLKHLARLVAATVLVGLTASAATPPTLTTDQRSELERLTLRLENAQLRALLAQRDVEEARRALLAVAKPLTVEGYDLDLSTLTYRPVVKSETPGTESQRR